MKNIKKVYKTFTIKLADLDELANILAYKQQDLLDSLSQGGRFSLESTEREIKQLIKSYLKEEKIEKLKNEGENK